MHDDDPVLDAMLTMTSGCYVSYSSFRSDMAMIYMSIVVRINMTSHNTQTSEHSKLALLAQGADGGAQWASRRHSLQYCIESYPWNYQERCLSVPCRWDRSHAPHAFSAASRVSASSHSK